MSQLKAINKILLHTLTCHNPLLINKSYIFRIFNQRISVFDQNVVKIMSAKKQD